MNIQDIVKDYLTKNGYTGLVNIDNDNCGCQLSDLFLCDKYFDMRDCKAGYKVMCDSDCKQGYDFEEGDCHIQEEKENE